MRKAITLPLILILLIGLLAPCSAETADQELEILFRDQPWDQDLLSYYKAIVCDVTPDVDVNSSEWEPEIDGESVFAYIDVNSEELFVQGEFREPYFYYGYIDLQDSDVTVAGYPVPAIEIFAIPMWNGEEMLREPDKNQVCFASYSLDPDGYDIDTVRAELTEKLSFLYGDIDLSLEAEAFPGEIRQRDIWLGANHTFVSLEVQGEGSYWGPAIYIGYGLTNMSELIEQIHKADPPFATTDMDGL